MPSPSVHHTSTIFQQLYETLPPCVPQEIREDMRNALEQIKNNYSLTLAELEDTMIVFGKRIWPYRQAFQEFLDIYEGKLGEQFLTRKMSRNLKKRYEEFKVRGGDFRDLHTGGTLGFFSAEERIELCEVLVAARQAARAYATQAVASADKLDYEDKIIEFSEVLDDIEKRLDTLRQTADDEQEHPELAAEIREQIRGFEYGLCSLGPHTTHGAVCEAEGFFEERRKEKNHQRSA